MKSIINPEPVCFLCRTPLGLHEHHVICGNGRRELSERYGLKLYLCWRCHHLVHNDHALDLELRKIGQQAWEDRFGSREEFISVFGRNWL